MGNYTLIADVVPWVKLYCPGAPDNLVTDALKRAFNEFFVKSDYLTEDIDITSVEDQAGYSIAATTTACVTHKIDKVMTLNSDSETVLEVDPTSYYFDMTNTKLTWEQGSIPTEDDLEHRVTVILRPDNRAATIVARVVGRWGERIAMGAASEILMLPDRPWTSPTLGVHLAEKFRAVIREAHRERSSKGVRRLVSLHP